jgi:hypothetical protein
MSAAANRKLLLDVFRAIEQRDDKNSANCCIPILNFTGRHRFLTAEARCAPGAKRGNPFNPATRSDGWIRASWL